VGVYGGYQPWSKRAGRVRSPGDGQVDFKRVFALLTEVGFDGWAVLEWECCLKSPEQGAAEGAPFIARHIMDVTEVAYDDFAAGQADTDSNRDGPRAVVEIDYRLLDDDDRRRQLDKGGVVGHGGGDLARFALGFPGPQLVQPGVAVGVEPAGDGLAVDAQVGRDVLACPAAVGREDDLEAVAEFAVIGSTEAAVEAFGFVARQLNVDQGAVLSQHGWDSFSGFMYQ
jgi:hypothetical protein